MKSKMIGFVMLAVTSMLASASARAEDAPAEGAAPAAQPAGTMSAAATPGAPESKMRVGLNLVPTPWGQIKGAGDSLTTAFAFGVLPYFDFNITPNIFVGVGPQYTFNVKPKDGGGDAAKELDLQVRVGGGAPIADKAQLYGYLTPGYSIVMPKSGNSAKGFMLGVHVGAMMDVAPKIFVAGELGYQLGFQKLDVDVGGSTTSVDSKFNYFQIGLGGGLRL